jgi:hypothetical protein
MSNKYTGKVDFQLGDKTYKLQYNYNALAIVLTKFGKQILSKLYEASPGELAFILQAGLASDGVTIEQIMEVSPPIFASCKLIDEAICYAYFGADGPPKTAADTKKKPEPKTK